MGNSGMIAGAFSSVSGKADSVLTTKGDLATYSTTRIREAVGNNNLVLMADSSQATGIKWGASSTSTLTTAGDLLVASGANTLSRLARGSDNYVLKMNGTSLNWEAESGSWVGTATSNLAMGNYDISATGTILFTADQVQISSGSITSTRTLCRIDTEGSASTDNLDVNAGSVVGNLLIYGTASSSRDVTVVNDTGTGKRHLLGADFTLDTIYDTATFCQLQDDDRIPCLSTSNNI